MLNYLFSSPFSNEKLGGRLLRIKDFKVDLIRVKASIVLFLTV
jgi:hypothetical protein